MAKDNSQVGLGQIKVMLKPTDVGLLVMKRMERPHLDKSAELRRLIELGYAAEQAGFILDGTVLRHAGRAWETQPDLREEGGQVSSSVPSVIERPITQRPDPVQRKDAGRDPDQAGEDQGNADVDKAEAKSTLRSNLRGLSV